VCVCVCVSARARAGEGGERRGRDLVDQEKGRGERSKGCAGRCSRRELTLRLPPCYWVRIVLCASFPIVAVSAVQQCCPPAVRFHHLRNYYCRCYCCCSPHRCCCCLPSGCRWHPLRPAGWEQERSPTTLPDETSGQGMTLHIQLQLPQCRHSP
jgi:hypothetical protein